MKKEEIENANAYPKMGEVKNIKVETEKHFCSICGKQTPQKGICFSCYGKKATGVKMISQDDADKEAVEFAEWIASNGYWMQANNKGAADLLSKFRKERG